MKARFMTVAVCLATAVSLSFAEDATPSLGAGSKAVLFSFSGLSNLGAGAYNGGFGAKYYLMNPLALRASLTFGMASQDYPQGVFGHESAFDFGISAGAEYHLSFNRVSPYVGGMVGFRTISTEIEDSSGGGDRTQTNITPTAGVLGYFPGNSLILGGIGGVEFFITKELSLSAEYMLGWSVPMGYTAKTVTKTTAATTTTSVDIKGLSQFGITNSGALTIAVYF